MSIREQLVSAVGITAAFAGRSDKPLLEQLYPDGSDHPGICEMLLASPGVVSLQVGVDKQATQIHLLARLQDLRVGDERAANHWCLFFLFYCDQDPDFLKDEIWEPGVEAREAWERNFPGCVPLLFPNPYRDGFTPGDLSAAEFESVKAEFLSWWDETRAEAADLLNWYQELPSPVAA